jgi:hypothetical protein
MRLSNEAKKCHNTSNYANPLITASCDKKHQVTLKLCPEFSWTKDLSHVLNKVKGWLQRSTDIKVTMTT